MAEARLARTCGSCTACCKIMAIDALEKPPGLACVHRTGATGCAIYGAHPAECRAFACRWLIDPSLPHRLRPDQSKVVLTLEGNGLWAYCDPGNPLAWKRGPIHAYLKDIASRDWMGPLTVFARAGAHIWIITPTQEIDLGEMPTDAPLNVVKAKDGSAKVQVGQKAAGPIGLYGSAFSRG